MINANRLLLQEVLKRNFNFLITIINSRGEEKEIFLRKKKKDFLRENSDVDIRVILVDNYPRREDWECGIFYLTRNGETLYYKEKESENKIFTS